jgi:zinc protease
MTLLTSTVASAASTTLQALETLKRSNESIVRFTMDNGLTALIKEDHSAPVVSIQIWVGSGSIHESEFLGAGLSHYVEHMVFKGTPTRQPGDIAKSIHDLGGDLNAYTSLDRTVFHVDLPSRHWRSALEILSDAVLNPVFPESEWAKEKDVILREISMGRDNPDRVLNELLWRTSYSTHPYRIPVIGYADIFKTLTRDNLVDFYRRRYVTDNMIVSIVGDISAADAEAALRNQFGSIPRRNGPPPVIDTEPPQILPRFARETGPYKVSRLTIAFHTVSLTDPDAPALELLGSVVGNGQSSRLVQNIKEKQQLVHSIGAGSYTPRYPGLFAVEATFDPNKEADALKAIYADIASWATERFSKEEIEKARRMLLVGELSSLQTMHGQAASYASGELFMKNPRMSEAYLDKIARVTPQDLSAVAAKYLIENNRSTVILSPAGEAAPAKSTDAARSTPLLEHRVLPNGIPLIIRQDHHLPFIYVCAAFKGGTLSETETQAGITRMMSDLLTRGTTRQSAAEIAEAIESMGAELSPFCGHNSFGLQGRCLAPDAEKLLSIFFDCLSASTFPEDEINKQRVVQLAAISEQWEQPFFVAQNALDSMIFAGHPYRWNPLGRRESIEKISAADLRATYSRHIVSGNMALSVFGDVTTEQAERLVTKASARIQKGAAPVINPGPAQPTLPARSEKREPKEQCIVLLGFPGVTINDPRKTALEILESSLSGMSSRVFHSIREERGLAYYAGARQRIGLAPGLFFLFAGTRPDAALEVESLLAAEISRVAREGLQPDEISRARSQLIADHEMRLQNNMSLAVSSALNELYGLGYAYDFDTARRIESVTPDQIREAASSLLSTNKMAVSVVLPSTINP